MGLAPSRQVPVLSWAWKVPHPPAANAALPVGIVPLCLNQEFLNHWSLFCFVTFTSYLQPEPVEGDSSEPLRVSFHFACGPGELS